MKVSFNTIAQTNIIPVKQANKSSNKLIYSKDNPDVSMPVSCPAYFSNISFKGPEEKFLASYANVFNCAYTNRPMLSESQLKKAFSKLDKRPNAQSALDLLWNYKDYIYQSRIDVFNMFLDAQYKCKRDFADILLEHYPDAIERLKQKQIAVITDIGSLTDMLSQPIRDRVLYMVDDTLLRIEDGTFKRKQPLKAINRIRANKDDKIILNEIYNSWYRLPRSSGDTDAFIANEIKKSHTEIAQDLISPAKFTIEHVKPQSLQGPDSLTNYVPTCEEINNDKNSTILSRFIKLNPQWDIPGNLQIFMDAVIAETILKGTPMSQRSWYPEVIKKRLFCESSGLVNLDTSKLFLTKEQKRDNTCHERLISKYKK